MKNFILSIDRVGVGDDVNEMSFGENRSRFLPKFVTAVLS